MKPRTLKLVAAITFFVALAVPIRPSAQEHPVTSGHKRHHLSYKLIDLGTLGGPNSAETLEFPFINNTGMVVGFADTAAPDPTNPGGFLPHAFRWQDGVLTDLGTLPDGLGSFAIWSNNRGQVVGLSGNGLIDPLLGAPEGRGVLWGKKGTIRDLGTLGGNQSLAGALNERGQIIGVAANTIPDPYSLFGWATQTRGFIWEKGTMRDLGTLGGADTGPSFINERGQVAGVSYVNFNPPPDPDLCGFPITTHPFFWEDGKMVDVGTLGGTCGSTATINNRGQVAGSSNLPGDEILHPFLWERGKLDDLGTFGGTFGVANWLNDAGEVTGVASTVDDQEFHAFFWKNGVMTDIGTINEDVCSIPHFMNSRGQVVGTSGCTEVGFEVHGFVWQPGGFIIDLNDFVPPGSDLRVTDGETINDRGEIAGSGLLPNGDFHAIVLIPCDDEEGDREGCEDAGHNVNANSSRQPSLGRAPAGQSNLSPKEMVTAIRARFAHRYHIPSRGTPRN
jgi:probable HAF family extracellular repeat protein